MENSISVSEEGLMVCNIRKEKMKWRVMEMYASRGMKGMLRKVKYWGKEGDKES